MSKSGWPEFAAEGKESADFSGIPEQGRPVSLSRPVKVSVRMLLPSDSPRLDGVSSEHAAVLAEADGTGMPPIIVHRPSMRVIDGMHRLRAVILRGDDTIEVRYFDGDDHDAFVVGVQANIAHGLPLKLVDRTTAAQRIIRTHPEWSDRVIGSVTGLATKTVRSLRSRSPKEAQPERRVGRDGRVRPVDAARGRRLASAFILENPDASVREIARAAAVAPSTALSVRNQIRAGKDPHAVKFRKSAKKHQDDTAAGAPAKNFDRASVLRILRKDPALRFSEAGRVLLRHLDDNPLASTDGTELIRQVPPHCATLIAKLARHNADSWGELARLLDELGEPSDAARDA